MFGNFHCWQYICTERVNGKAANVWIRLFFESFDIINKSIQLHQIVNNAGKADFFSHSLNPILWKKISLSVIPNCTGVIRGRIIIQRFCYALHGRNERVCSLSLSTVYYFLFYYFYVSYTSPSLQVCLNMAELRDQHLWCQYSNDIFTPNLSD